MIKQTKKRTEGKRVIILIVSIVLLLISIFWIAYGACCGKGGSYYEKDGKLKHISKSHSYSYAINHPAFEGFGQYILPWQNNALATITSPLRMSFLMPMLVTTADIDKVIESFNYMIDYCNETGNKLFYDYYTEEDKAADASKNDTGLVFMKGNEGAPFALVCPGGGYVNVEANHEGYPVAKVLHEKGYNVFILRYRVKSSYEIKGSTTSGNGYSEDAVNALKFIIDNANSLGVSDKNYSLWGFSAGGDVAGTLANPENEYGYLKATQNAPAAALLGYPVPTTQSSHSCPFFVTMAKNDDAIDFSSVEQWVNEMQEDGIKVKTDYYETCGHGYGTGYGKEGDGWMEKAIAYWEENMYESN